MSPQRAVAPEKQRVQPANWWLLAVLFLLYAISIVNRQMLAILAPGMKADLHLSDLQLGILMGPAFALLFVILGLPLGWAADNLSRKWIIFAGSLAAGLASIGGAFATSFGMVLLVRALVGAGEAALSPGAYSLIADRFPGKRLTTAISIYNMGLKTGLSLSFLVGFIALWFGVGLRQALPVLAPLADWRLVFVVVGTVATIVALLTLTLDDRRLVETGRRDGDAPPGGLFAFCREHRWLVLRLLTGFSILSITGLSVTYWTPSYLTRHFHKTASEAGSILALISIIAAGSLVIKGLIIDRLYARGMMDAPVRFYSWMLLPCIFIGPALCFIENYTVYLVLSGIVQVIAIPFVAYSIAGFQLFVPSHLRGQITALLIMTYNVVGSSIGPVVTGALTDHLAGTGNGLGYAMSIINAITFVPAFFLIRSALPALRREIERARSADVPIATPDERVSGGATAPL